MVRITIPLEVQTSLRRALNKAGNRECGGVLMGEHVDFNHFAVRSITVQKHGNTASFVRSLVDALKAIKDFFTANQNDYRRFNYLGEWHSHPLFSIRPSAQDHSTMIDLATDEKVGANFLVLLIFLLKASDLEGSAHTYLPDGSVHRSELDLEKRA
jgi:proteasome lid subunit RPN8/RPN11